jgi:uncharacterized protein (UPF0332 family)
MAPCDDYAAKALENLASAESEWTFGRLNSCTRSAYYACFHAAIAALIQARLAPPEPSQGWGHDWVQAQFVGQLIQRRKVYPAPLRRTLTDLLDLRHRADYRIVHVSRRDAQHAVREAQVFVQTVTASLSREGGNL